MIPKILNAMIKSNAISEEQVEIYQFGLECLLIKSFYMLSGLVIALFLRNVTGYVIFYIVYSWIRTSAGGFHADTRLKCYLFSIMQIVIVLVGYAQINSLPQERFFVVMGLMLLIGIIAEGVIWKLAPVEHPNRPLDEEEKVYYSKKVKRILLVMNLLVVLLGVLQRSDLGILLISAVIMEAFMLLLQKSKENE